MDRSSSGASSAATANGSSQKGFCTIGEIMSARKALSGYVYETPVINSNALSRKCGHDKVLLKCENLQRTGSYHLRGHMYKVLRTIEKELDVDNFITFSTANGGAALSCAATAFQAKAHIVVPEKLNDNITRSIKHYGGSYVETKGTPEERKRAVDALMERYNRTEGKVQHKAVYVHPYTDRYVIAGYGTMGVELMLQTDCHIDCIVAPVGGGSLLFGLAIAAKAMKPNIAVFGAEPAVRGVGDPYVFFKRGDTNPPDDSSDANHTTEKKKEGNNSTEAPPSPRVVRGPALRSLLDSRFKKAPVNLIDGMIRVTEEEIRYAFRFVYQRCKLVVDSKSATAVAAVVARAPELDRYKNVAIILSGGNVDLNDVPKMAASSL